MSIPTEPIGSIPRSHELQAAIQGLREGRVSEAEVLSLQNAAVQDTIERFEATGSPVITDGEQSKPSFATYPVHGMKDLAPDGVIIPFADGHTRQLPCLTAGPFQYQVYAATYLESAQRYAHVPIKQPVIAASALSLLYPRTGSTAMRGRRLSGTSSQRQRPTSERACEGGPTRSRWTSRREGSRSSSILRSRC
jgi:5-methyltetrahydropteroyltriglutamate--homocysteine methyltransferase